jgi:cobalt-zinc-cadmium efflux system outer membrane protein
MRHRLLALFFLLLAALPGIALAADAAASRPLSLAEVDALVAGRNRQLISVRRATAAAEAGLDIAGARPNPVVSLNTSGINSKHLSSNDSLDTVLRIDQPFERGGKRDLRLAVADALLAASRSDENDSLRQQKLLARQAYYDLKAAEEKASLSTESGRLARQVLIKAELRLKVGDLSVADVARIRTDTLKAESDATQARIDAQRARLVLAQLLAMETDAPHLTATDPWPALQPLAAVDPDIEQRPDVIAARRRVAAAEKSIDLAKAQQVRDITIGAQVERSDQVQERNTTMLGIGISIPLFTGYDYRGEIRQAYVVRDQAQDDLERILATARAEFSQSAFEADRLGERARQLRDEALPAARRANAAVQFAFSQGAASALDVIDSRRSLHAVETDTTNALADAAKARAAWAAALNRPDMP